MEAIIYLHKPSGCYVQPFGNAKNGMEYVRHNGGMVKVSSKDLKKIHVIAKGDDIQKITIVT